MKGEDACPFSLHAPYLRHEPGRLIVIHSNAVKRIVRG